MDVVHRGHFPDPRNLRVTQVSKTKQKNFNTQDASKRYEQRLTPGFNAGPRPRPIVIPHQTNPSSNTTNPTPKTSTSAPGLIRLQHRCGSQDQVLWTRLTSSWPARKGRGSASRGNASRGSARLRRQWRPQTEGRGEASASRTGEQGQEQSSIEPGQPGKEQNCVLSDQGRQGTDMSLP